MAAPADDWEHIFSTPRRAHAIKLRVAQAPWSVIGSLFRAEKPGRGSHPWAWARLDEDSTLIWAPPGPDEPGPAAFLPAPPAADLWPPARLVEAARFDARQKLRWDVPLHLAHVWVPAPAQPAGTDWSGSTGQTFLLIVCPGTRRATLWRATPMGSPLASAETRAALLRATGEAVSARWGGAFDVRFETAPRAVDDTLLHDRAGTSEAAVTEAALPVLGALAWAASHHDTGFPGGAVYAMLGDAATFARLLGSIDRVDATLAGGGSAGLLPSLGEEHAPRAPVAKEAPGMHHAQTRVGAMVRAALGDWPDRELAAEVEALVRANDALAAATLVARVLNHVPAASPRHAALADLERALVATAREPWMGVGGGSGSL